MNKVLITGATSGLGRAIAERFISAGKTVYLHGRNPEPVEALLSGSRCFFCGADLRDLSQLPKLAALVRQEEIGCFVSNAGVYSDQGISIADDVCADLLIANLVAPIILMKDIYACYKDRKGGTIVSINSLAGLSPNFNEAVYCASKHGLSGFVKSLQIDACRNNVTILDYYPGAIQTRITRNREGYGEFIKAEDVAELIVSNVLSSQSFVPVSQVLRKRPSA